MLGFKRSKQYKHLTNINIATTVVSLSPSEIGLFFFLFCQSRSWPKWDRPKYDSPKWQITVNPPLTGIVSLRNSVTLCRVAETRRVQHNHGFELSFQTSVGEKPWVPNHFSQIRIVA